MPSRSKATEEKLNTLENAWKTLAPGKTFGAMTLTQFQAATKASRDARAQIAALDAQMTALLNARNDADQETITLIKRAVDGIKADPENGPDSDLYEAAGYTRESEKKRVGGRPAVKPDPPKP